MKRNAVGIVASALFAALVGNSAGAQTYSVMNLGLGGPPHSTGIAGINAQGQVAGTSLTATGEHAFFATQTDGNIDIGMAGSLRTQAGALNASGQIIGFAEIFDARGNRVDHAFSWTRDGGMIDLGTLGGLHSWATAVNDAGTVIGDSYLPDNLTTHAFMWTKTGGMVDLGSLGGNTQAYAINAQGQIVGYSRDTNGALHAVLWNPGTGIKDLGILPTSSHSSATLINDVSQIVGYAMWLDANNQVQSQHPFLYTEATGMSDLGALGPLTSPSKLNASGRVIGSWYASRFDTDTHAWTWTAADGLVGLSLGGVSSVAMDVNSAGKVTGWSFTAAGVKHAFSWTKAGGIVDLGTLGGSSSIALNVNTPGQIVGQAALTGNTTTHAFLYEGGVMKDLNTLVVNKPAGLELLAAARVNDSGSMIAYTNTGVVLLSQTAPAMAPPAVGPISANDPIAIGAPVSVSASFTDAAADTHTAWWNFGDGSGTLGGSVSEANGSGTAMGSHTYYAAGVYPVILYLTDSDGLLSVVSRNVVVYDPSAGFVTGSGSILSPAGAYKPDPAAMGPATFSFVSKYQKGANKPTGSTDFLFQTASLSFYSETYDWLVVAGARAQYKGTGKLNGVDNHNFMLTAVDGKVAGNGSPDRFRIKISRYDEALKQDVVVYDNQLSATDEGTVSEGTAIASGNIVVHASKN